MIRPRLFTCVASFLWGAALIAACVGEDPSTVPSDRSDGAPPLVEASTDDGAVEAGPGAEPPEKRLCSLAERDAGLAPGSGPPSPPVVERWSTDPPTSAGTPTIVAPLAHGGCVINVATVPLTPPGQSPSVGILLYKVDAPGSRCDQPKGYRLLGSSYAPPNVKVAQHAFDPRLFVVSYGVKASPSGSAPVNFTVAQFDFTTGDMLHRAGFAVKGTPPAPPGPSDVWDLVVHGCNLIVRGSGTFPGAVGASSGSFSATYAGFLAPEPQPLSFADSAMYQGG